MQSEPLPVQAASEVFELKCQDLACDASLVELLVRSKTVVTFRCAKCRFTWSVGISKLPAVLRKRLEALPAVY